MQFPHAPLVHVCVPVAQIPSNPVEQLCVAPLAHVWVVAEAMLE